MTTYPEANCSLTNWAKLSGWACRNNERNIQKKNTTEFFVNQARLTQSVEWQAFNLLVAGPSPASGFFVFSFDLRQYFQNDDKTKAQYLASEPTASLRHSAIELKPKTPKIKKLFLGEELNPELLRDRQKSKSPWKTSWFCSDWCRNFWKIDSKAPCFLKKRPRKSPGFSGRF